MSTSASTSTSTTSAPVNRHAPTAVERQRTQLEKLLKDPAKPAYVPPAPIQKTIRPPREMMKNVQGSSAGAGSGEFHVYKASRRREYERLKLLEEESTKETLEAEFERRRREAEEAAAAKTAKNRAKRQKKKERKGKGGGQEDGESGEDEGAGEGGKKTQKLDLPIKKRRLVNGKELVFRKPGEEESEDEDEREAQRQQRQQESAGAGNAENGGREQRIEKVAIVEEPRIIIHEE